MSLKGLKKWVPAYRIYCNDVYPMSTRTGCLTDSVLYFLLKCNFAKLEKKTCASSHLNVEALHVKCSLEKEWEKILQSTICAVVKGFRGRLEKIIKAKGGHIEQ